MTKMTQYIIKRRYIRKLKKLGYRYSPVGSYYFLDEGDIRHVVTKPTRLYELIKFKKRNTTIKFLNEEHPCEAYSCETISDVKPNVPKKWYVEEETEEI